MPPAPSSRPAPRVLLVGSFPPVGGPASAASLAALRRAWAEGDEVVTASLRAGSAELVARVAGPLAGWRLEQARVAAGRPPSLVLGLDEGQLRLQRSTRSDRFPGSAPASLMHRAVSLAMATVTVAGLLVSFDRFERVSVLVTGSPRLPRPLGRILWRHVDAVVVEAGQEGAATAAGVPPGQIRTVERYEGPPRQPGVSLLGPPEVIARDLPLVAAGALGRRLLGGQFMPVRARVIRLAREAKRAVSARRG